MLVIGTFKKNLIYIFMLGYDFLNPEDKKELITLANSNENLEDKIDSMIFFFQKIISNYDKEDFVESLSSFIIEILFNLKSQLISFFFMEIFGLRAPHYCGVEEDEIKYVILPSLSLVKLNEKGFDISKIIGGFLQLDHEGDMGYQISQIIEYLLLHNFFETKEIISLLIKILQNDYASSLRIGRFLGTLIEYSVLEINDVIEIIHLLSSDLNLEIKSVSDLLIGANNLISSNKKVYNLIGQVLRLHTPDLKFLDDPHHISDQIIGLANVISNYFYENRSLSNLIRFIFNIKTSPILAEAFKYLIDNSIINMKRIAIVLREDLYFRRLELDKVGLLISINFSIYEISKFLVYIISKENQNLNYEYFVKILQGFYNKSYHGFKDSDIIQILKFLQKINPKILDDYNINDYELFLNNLKFKNNVLSELD